MVDHVLVFGDVDQNGEWTTVIVGEFIVPDRQYQYFFYSTDIGVYNDVTQYKVDLTTKQLVKK